MKKLHLVCVVIVALVFGFSCVALAKDPIKIQTPSYPDPDCEPDSCSFDCAPLAVGPYSQAIQYGELVFLSGQIALDPCSQFHLPATEEDDYIPQKIVTKDGETDIWLQAERVMRNLGAVLKAAGLNFNDVVSSTVYLKKLSDFKSFNAVYGMYFSCNPDSNCAYDYTEYPPKELWCCDTVNPDPYCNKNCRGKNKDLPPPARATVAVAEIPGGSLLEVSMIAGK